ncbi:MAG: DUF222 domain-containing protein [Propionibacteriales bacterium]|nr:DUF222 domain-containing protein [Propionibacteriales bacterium]
MFDREVVDTLPPGPELGRLLVTVDHTELDTADTLCWLRAHERQKAYQAAHEADLLAHFADLNSTLDPVEEDLHDRQVKGTPRLIQVGGDGTPTVHEFCLTELAATLKCSEGRARYLLADALDLHHRLPQTLTRMHQGALSGYRASLITRQSRCLPKPGAGQLEEELGATACRVGDKRLCDEVDRLLIDLDPERAARRAKDAAESRYVHVERDPDPAGDGNGVAFLNAKIDAFSAQAFDQALNTVAGMLKSLGVTGDHDVLRAQALGWLAN